jgi:hypothetical protein
VKEQKNNKTISSRTKLLIVAIVGVILVVVAYLGIKAMDYNFARDDAQPLVKALEAKGAKKLCSREDSGRGMDNKAPWYYALFEVSADREQATKTALEAMKENGFDNFKGSAATATPDVVNTYSDEASKKNTHTELKDGNVGLTVEALLNTTYSSSDNRFCGTQQTDNAPAGKTIIRITLGLPEYK